MSKKKSSADQEINLKKTIQELLVEQGKKLQVRIDEVWNDR